MGEGKAAWREHSSLMRTLNMPSQQGQQRLNSLGRDNTEFYPSLIRTTKPKIFLNFCRKEKSGGINMLLCLL